MILVDTSVWIDHLRSGDEQLIKLLTHSQVVIHPMVIGEIACGNLQNRKQILALLKNLPLATESTHNEALHCLEQNRLMGKGIGFVDLHLIAATLLSSHTSIWTRDKKLKKISDDLGISWQAPH